MIKNILSLLLLSHVVNVLNFDIPPIVYRAVIITIIITIVAVKAKQKRYDAYITYDNISRKQNVYEMETVGDQIKITFSHTPNHTMIGQFQGEQREFRIPANPKPANTITEVPNTSFNGISGRVGYVFGIALTGVLFDPVAGKGWINICTGEYNYEWDLEVMINYVGLAYNYNNVYSPQRHDYHRTPIQQIRAAEDGTSHSKLLGYAADGFPIYYKYAYQNTDDMLSNIVALASSYRIKEGCRPGDGISAPNGIHDGTYVADYEYIEGLGDLDECNGRWAKTPEFPEGTYAYYITDEFPSIPRYFKGKPSPDFEINLP